jgi:hypothetical protein
LNQLQQVVLHSCRDSALLNNSGFTGLGYPRGGHQIYSLKGLERLWPHRVNSLQRLAYLLKEFRGFECDIIFDPATGSLDIAHDPDERIRLRFDDYLALAGTENKLFWMDVKNLTPQNAAVFCQRLQVLDQRYALRDRVIVESVDTAAVALLDASGWLSSLYLPYELPPDSMGRAKLVAGLRDFLSLHHCCLSEDIRMQPWMQHSFPGIAKLAWDLAFRHSLDRSDLLRLANNQSLLLCLINVKSPGYR